MSSDILESQFGPTEVSVLYQDEKTRVICTRAKSDGQVLELSRVLFDPAGIGRFPRTHAAVLAGQSMGKAFRSDGIEFRRETETAYRRTLPANFHAWFGSRRPATVVAVSIMAGPDRQPYAEILEVYSPAVAWPQAGGQPRGDHPAVIKALGELLAGNT